MAARTTNKYIVVNEHEQLRNLDAADQDDLKHFALASIDERDGEYTRPVLSLRNGKLHARNYVGIIETKRNTVVEILPKVDFATDDADTRDAFLKMLRAYRGLRFAEFNQTSVVSQANH